MLLDELCREITSIARGIRVVSAGAGVRYTFVVTASSGRKFLGMAYTPIEDLTHGDSEAMLEAYEALREGRDPCLLAESPYPLVKSLLVAYLNSSTAHVYEPPSNAVGVDVLDVMRFSEQDVVAVVGYIGPVIKGLAGRVKEIIVLERNPRRRGQALPDVSAPRALKRATKVIVTGATLVNDTIDLVLGHSTSAEAIALVGATASLHPEPLFRRGVSVVAGFRVSPSNIEEVIKALTLGGGTGEVYRYGYKYTVTRRSST